MTVIVVDVFFDHAAKRIFSKEDHLTQAFGFDASEKAFDERVVPKRLIFLDLVGHQLRVVACIHLEPVKEPKSKFACCLR